MDTPWNTPESMVIANTCIWLLKLKTNMIPLLNGIRWMYSTILKEKSLSGTTHHYAHFARYPKQGNLILCFTRGTTHAIVAILLILMESIQWGNLLNYLNQDLYVINLARIVGQKPLDSNALTRTAISVFSEGTRLMGFMSTYDTGTDHI